MVLENLTRKELEEKYNKITTEKNTLEEKCNKITTEKNILEEKYQKMNVELKAAQMKIEWYEEQIRIHKQKRFGASSEKTQVDNQISLFNEPEAEQAILAPEPKEEEVLTPKAKKRYGHKKEITKQFPVEVIEYKLPEEEQICTECGEKLHEMSKKVHVELRLIPAKIVKEEHVQYIYSCRNCEKNGTEKSIISAPAPKPVIRNSLASPSLLTYIITRKYLEALPLYRQEQEFKKEGINLTRQTLANWIINISNAYFRYIYEYMHKGIVKKDVLHADETEVEVLNEPDKEATTKSYMWMYRTRKDDETPIVLYEYQPGRNGEYARDFLKNFKGYLHVDGYPGYHKIPDVKLVGCWAHARRKYDEALVAIKDKENTVHALSRIGLDYCNRLFKIEEQIKDLSPEEKYQKRQEESKPLLEEYLSWAEETAKNALPKSALGVAVNYTINQKDKLKMYIEDGRLDISNNIAERAIRPFVIGRGNWLFCNSTQGANASSVIYSIIETAKENKVNVNNYIEYLLKELPNINVKEANLEKYMPWSSELPNRVRQ